MGRRGKRECRHGLDLDLHNFERQARNWCQGGGWLYAEFQTAANSAPNMPSFSSL